MTKFHHIRTCCSEKKYCSIHCQYHLSYYLSHHISHYISYYLPYHISYYLTILIVHIMQSITAAGIRALVATSPPGPPANFIVNEETVGPYECPVCLLFQPRLMIFHTACMKAICAQCLLINLDGGKPCPCCRGELGAEASRPNLIKPPPYDILHMEKVEWVCTRCRVSMKEQETHHHNKDCAR